MTDRDALLAGILSDPLEETRWLVLADWLEEFDDPRRAELLRLHRRMLATCCEPDAHPERAAWQARMTELLVAGVRPCVPQETLTLPGGVPMTFSFIPPGAFLMGSKNSEDEKPVHFVEVPRGFFMGVYPVTQAQWFAVMGTDPSKHKGPALPVEKVSWDDCQGFCAKLSKLSDRRIELPTEAWWEYACRAGTTTDYFFGDKITANFANYAADIGSLGSGAPTAVGSFPANAWGLYDMHGNVWESCADTFAPTAVEMYRNGFRSGERWCACRGGHWGGPPAYCRACSRMHSVSTWPSQHEGFRVCLRLT